MAGGVLLEKEVVTVAELEAVGEMVVPWVRSWGLTMVAYRRRWMVPVLT